MQSTDVFRERLKAVRERRQWSRQRLADRLTDAGFPMTGGVIKKIETGSKKTIDVNEVLALSAALSVSPLHMLVPIDDDTPIEVTPKTVADPPTIRQWIRGTNPLDADWRRGSEAIQALPDVDDEDGGTYPHPDRVAASADAAADWRIYATEIPDSEMSDHFASARQTRARWLEEAPAEIEKARARGDDELVAFLEYAIASGNVPLPLHEFEVTKEES